MVYYCYFTLFRFEDQLQSWLIPICENSHTHLLLRGQMYQPAWAENVTEHRFWGPEIEWLDFGVLNHHVAARSDRYQFNSEITGPQSEFRETTSAR